MSMVCPTLGSRTAKEQNRTATYYLLLLLHPFNGLFSRTTWVNRYHKGKISLDLTESRDDGVLGWQWHQPDHMQTICTSLTDNLITQFLDVDIQFILKYYVQISTEIKYQLDGFILLSCWGLSAGYQPRPQVVDRGTTARYGGQLRYI